MNILKRCSFVGVALLSTLVSATTVEPALFAHSAVITFPGVMENTTLENFPVLIRLAENQPAGFHYADCASGSFCFTDAAGNLLAYDVEAWNTSGTSLIWVNMPTLTRNTPLYFRYGATTTLPANNPAAVWSAAGYVGVWHLSEASGDCADSSGNGLVAVHEGSDTASYIGVAGVAGTARQTAKTNAGYLSIPNYDSLAVGGTFTISSFVKLSEVVSGSYPRLFSRKKAYADDNGWEIELAGGSSTKFNARASKNDKYVSGSLPDLLSGWQHVALVYDDTSLTVYGNGDSVVNGTVANTKYDNGYPLSIGCDSDGNETYARGAFDEVRLRRVTSNAEWLKTECDSVKSDNFVNMYAVDAGLSYAVTASAGTGGTVAIDGGTPGASVSSDSFEYGTTKECQLVAAPQSGYVFFRWKGDVNCISAGSAHSASITVITPYSANLTAEFLPENGGQYLKIVNSFVNPLGGTFTSDPAVTIADTFFEVKTDRIITFAAPEEGEEGLLEFHSDASNSGLCSDWGYINAFAPGLTATKVDKVVAAAEVKSDLTTDKTVYTYAGSWYVPADTNYSFYAKMRGIGQLVIDNRQILSMTSDNTAYQARAVALKAGWHNLYINFLAKNEKIGPVDATVGGLLYSADNADLATQPSLGAAFGSTAGGHKVSTAFNGILVPSMFASAGAEMVIDCSNVLGDLRVGGQLGSIGNGRFAFANLPTGRTVEIGRPFSNDKNGRQDFKMCAYVDFAHAEFPAGVNLRFEGGVVLNNLPSGNAWSLGTRLLLATSVSDFFGTVSRADETYALPSSILELIVTDPKVFGTSVKIQVGAGQSMGYCGGMYLTNNNSLPIRANSTSPDFPNEVELAKGGVINSTSGWDFNGKFSGKITGQGDLRTNGWGRRMNVYASVTAELAHLGQRACRINLRPPAGAEPSVINSATIAGEKTDAAGGSGWDYDCASLFYCPQALGEPPLTIGKVTANGAFYFTDRPSHRFAGAMLSTCSNNTIRVGSLVGSGVHLRTLIPQATNTDPVEIDRGPGNFVIGSIDRTMNVFVSSNVYLTVTNVNSATAFRYDAMSNGVNCAHLDIEGTCTDSTITATDIAMLPGRVKGFVGTVTLTETKERTYPVTIDFDRDVYCLGGTDGSGTLAAAPATGHIEVAFKGTPVKGDYALARFTEGGEKLAAWTVTAPNFYDGFTVDVVKDSTGIWLAVHKSGMIMFLK